MEQAATTVAVHGNNNIAGGRAGRAYNEAASSKYACCFCPPKFKKKWVRAVLTCGMYIDICTQCHVHLLPILFRGWEPMIATQ